MASDRKPESRRSSASCRYHAGGESLDNPNTLLVSHSLIGLNTFEGKLLSKSCKCVEAAEADIARVVLHI